MESRYNADRVCCLDEEGEVGAYRSWDVNEKIFSTAIAIVTVPAIATVTATATVAATATATAIATVAATATATRNGKFCNEMLTYETILRESWLLQPFNRASINTQHDTENSVMRC